MAVFPSGIPMCLIQYLVLLHAIVLSLLFIKYSCLFDKVQQYCDGIGMDVFQLLAWESKGLESFEGQRRAVK